MSYGNQKFEVGIASGASTSSYFDTGGRGFRTLSVHYVTMSTGALVSVYGSDSATGTYLPVFTKDQDGATHNALTVATNVSGGWGVIPAPPLRYLKLITSAVVSGGVSFTVIANGD